VIAFIEKLEEEPVDLMGHSRGGHISFRVAQRRPDLLRRLVLVEPGGECDAMLDPAAKPGPSALGARIAASAEKIGTGDVEGGLTLFFDAIEGPGAWPRLPAAAKQQLRDNAMTLIGRPAISGRRFPKPMWKRSGRRHCSSAAPTPRARCRMCRIRSPRMFPAQGRR
jgi:pimeloyl-ACP methyl ester carboxylesterase